MTAQPKIWILDDDELLEIRNLLAAADIEFGEGETAPDTKVQLLITSARRALLDLDKRPSSDTQVVVVEEASRGLRRVLERCGCDLVVSLPLNQHAFRLLLNYALYEGPERRRSRRVMLGSPVKIKRGLHWSNSLLVSLSMRGCGLITEAALRVGQEQEIKIPGSVTRMGDLRLTGRVLCSQAAEGSGFETALTFRLIDPEDRRTLAALLEQHAANTELRPRNSPAKSPPALALNPHAAAQPPPAEVASDGDPGDSRGSERRRGDRKHYTRRVLAAGAGMAQVLIGRDLSSGGMRVRPDPDLELGDVLKLAIHGHPGLPAIMVKARVMRDDGADGMVLHFEEVPNSIAGRLEEMVDRLPSLPQGRGLGTPSNVVSEVLGRE